MCGSAGGLCVRSVVWSWKHHQWWTTSRHRMDGKAGPKLYHHHCIPPIQRNNGWNSQGMTHQSNDRLMGWPGRATISPNLRLDFMHWHMEGTIIILNKGTGPHHQCYQCDMFLPREALAAGNICTKIWRRGWRKIAAILPPMYPGQPQGQSFGPVTRS